MESMDFFINGDWKYINSKIYVPISLMSPAEIAEFNIETKNIIWEDFVANYMKGIGVWALNEDHISPEHGFEQLLIKNPKKFEFASFYFKK